ncbi:NADH-ubiquinone oxidoreductase-F iron-sulfur binding region domain-containing protein [Haladaptatus sp. DYSN1]|uniref:NADH-ubiquinone oxidoreductase-F iron-sulfur binding region domain-containing protein n=1 Tax=unclassified Haladaptatus TaxID=2622732 RepID=UPI0024061D6F|nr:NADH-ubiquinone oxidoreductase-F iron-sulfur binding region domain-containing protein [Haladaptatus sp. DYSN1]
MGATTGAVGRQDAVRICAGPETRDRARALASRIREATERPVFEVGSTGITGIEPLVLVTREGETAFYEAPTDERLDELAESFDDSPSNADAVVEHDPARETLPLPETGPLAVGTRRVLARCGWAAPGAPADAGEFVFERIDDETADTVRNCGLLGRGRGDGSTDQPIATAWDLAREAEGDPVVVVNGNESDARNHTDHLLLESDPLAVLDGALTVAQLGGGDDPADVVVYLNESETLAQERVRAAVEALADERDLDGIPEVVAGPDRFIAGEMTMALEAMEGKDRLEARLRPPTPAEVGLYGRPTVIHTPRTLAQVREAVRSPDTFDPEAADPGTRLVTVSGDVDAPATVELPTTASLSAARDAVTVDGPLKLACVGGQFGGLTDTLSHEVSAPALARANLGTDGAVELFGERTCPVALAGTRSRFAYEENCGRCVPCREGSTQLVNLLRDVYDGQYARAKIQELARVMRETSTCDFGRMASRPATTAMATFEADFVAHAEGRCPSGVCEGM